MNSFKQDETYADWLRARAEAFREYPARMAVAWHVLTMRSYTSTYHTKKGVFTVSSMLGRDLSVPIRILDHQQKLIKHLRKFYRDKVPKNFVLEAVNNSPDKKELRKVVHSVYKGKLQPTENEE